MSIRREPFGKAEKCTIHQGDLEVSVLTYGATIQAIRYQGIDVALGYDSLEEYRNYGAYLGATVGRYANRIGGGKFTLNGVEYDVGCNEEGRGHLHGGRIGLDKKLWTVREQRENSICLAVSLADGEEGYPGNMELTVTFSVEENALKIVYDAVSDKDTVFNPTNHCYFNLNGIGGGRVENHLLTVHADAFTPVDEWLLPTGELRPVTGTPFDFTVSKAIGAEVEAEEEQIRLGGGYDHNFVLRGEGYRSAAVAVSPETGIRMECFTDLPGLQLYTGNFLEQPTGKAGPIGKRRGFCFETQFFPDSPNRPEFPSCTLRAGKRFASTTVYRFERK
ncbi:MAG: galactose mutarotase [Clostridia bacterium]|nr:galactose mutarotase [Clostridia bacterium]